MKIMFNEITSLFYVQSRIEASDGYRSDYDGYKEECNEHGERLLEKRAALVDDILNEIIDNDKNKKCFIRNMKATYCTKNLLDEKWSNNFKLLLKESVVPIHKMFLEKYISGKFDFMPKDFK